MRLLIPAVILLLLGAAASADDLEGGEPLLEGMPDYMLEHVMPGSLLPTAYDKRAQYAWTDTAVLWDRGQTVKVCFLTGSPAARARIAAIANEWNSVGADIRLDFGPMDNPRLCTGNGATSEVRVSFSQPGYFSLTGRDSLVAVAAGLPSLNLQRFDYPTVSNKEFRRLVLHEFGHALGLMHEQQRPDSGCDLEYEWETKVYPRMTLNPPYWSRRQVDLNMRQIKVQQQFLASPFDPRSIMLYAYPADFYRTQPSPCFSPGNSEISEGDRRVLRLMYADPEVDKKRLEALSKAYIVASTDDEKVAIATYAMTLEEIAGVRAAEVVESAETVFAWQASYLETSQLRRDAAFAAIAHDSSRHRASILDSGILGALFGRDTSVTSSDPDLLLPPEVPPPPAWFVREQSQARLESARHAAISRMSAAREEGP